MPNKQLDLTTAKPTDTDRLGDDVFLDTDM